MRFRNIYLYALSFGFLINKAISLFCEAAFMIAIIKPFFIGKVAKPTLFIAQPS
ncbi:hypothetical protein [Campylobacter pinnipediorum]|uniref:hypothetical protein n=1 Tax=Campylobacter pinnipediorum TaxID=1965231 RepID=UPI0012FF5FC3|nr:hypothetical protein [Campylobacter pinnipediorum]